MTLIRHYNEAEVAQGMSTALVRRQIGARYVRIFIDQARFALGLNEPPPPVVTGNATADNAEVHPHPLESYDNLIPAPRPSK